MLSVTACDSVRATTSAVDVWTTSSSGFGPADETVERAGDGSVELVVTFAVRDLFLRRLDVDAGESPVGCRFWYRKKRR